MTARSGALLGLLLLGAALVVLLVVTTPWTELPGGKRGPVTVAGDFTRAEVDREEAFHSSVRPPAYAGLVAGLLAAALLGLTPWGARVVTAVGRPLGGGWVARALVGGIVVGLVPRLVSLPFDARAEVVLRRYGLSTQTWAGWALDQLKGAGLSAALLAIAVTGFYAIARHSPERWWAWAGLGGAVLTVALSFGYPLVVEPVFNKFSSMPDSPLRSSLLELARQDGVPVKDVLVADASRRTTALNAYVSGLGRTRRIVVFDTLVEHSTPEEVRLVVAHELGHVKANDVRNGTLLSALGLMAGVCGLYLLLTWPALLRRVDVSGPADPRGVGLLLFLVAASAFLTGPLLNVVSRRVEARADLHALELTRDAQTFVEGERSLALTNLADLEPTPLLVWLFGSHPPTVERIGLARDWARREHVAVPGPLVSGNTPSP